MGVETAPRGEWVCSQLCDCLRWGARWGCPRTLATPVGLREAGCDLIFLMVLSLVLLGCGGSPPLPHTRTGYVGGLEALELFILLKPCYKLHPWKPFLLFLFRGRVHREGGALSPAGAPGPEEAAQALGPQELGHVKRSLGLE